MPFNLEFAKNFVAAAPLPPKPSVKLGTDAASTPTVFDDTKAQAMVVGSDVLSFEPGVEAEFRSAISDSALLAQFVANATTAASKNPIGWFDAYFGALATFGWVTQERDTAAYEFKSDGIEVHKAIIEVVSAFLVPGSAALALVVTTLNALQSMDRDSPLITLFDRESQHAKIGRFQVTLVRNDKDSGLMVEAMAFTLKADSAITQILFFKLHKAHTEVRRSLGKVSINSDALQTLRRKSRRKSPHIERRTWIRFRCRPCPEESRHGEMPVCRTEADLRVVRKLYRRAVQDRSSHHRRVERGRRVRRVSGAQIRSPFHGRRT